MSLTHNKATYAITAITICTIIAAAFQNCGDAFTPTANLSSTGDGSNDGNGGNGGPNETPMCTLNANFTLQSFAAAFPVSMWPQVSKNGIMYSLEYNAEANSMSVRRSLDRGATWLAPTVIDTFVPAGFGMSIPGMHVQSNGAQDVVLVYSTLVDEVNPGTETLRIFRSADGGISFAEVHNGSPTETYGLAARVSSNSGGVIVIGRIARELGEEDRRAFFYIVSEDFGLTWQNRALFRHNEIDTFSLNVIVDEDSTVYFSGQTLEPAGTFFSRSVDRGLTWTNVSNIVNLAGFTHSLKKVAAGVFVSVTGQVDANNPQLYNRTVSLSADGGVTWAMIAFDAAIPLSSFASSLNDVYVTPDGRLILPSSTLNGTTPYEVRISDDRGLTWQTAVLTQQPFLPQNAYFVTVGDGWDLILYAVNRDDEGAPVGYGIATGSCR